MYFRGSYSIEHSMLDQRNDLDDHPSDLCRHSSDFQRHSDDLHQKLSQPDLCDGDRHYLQSALHFIEEVALQFGIKRRSQIPDVSGQDDDDFTQAHPVFSAVFSASTDADDCDSSRSCQVGQGEAPSFDAWDAFVKTHIRHADDRFRSQLRRNQSSRNLTVPKPVPKSDDQSAKHRDSSFSVYIPKSIRPLPDFS